MVQVFVTVGINCDSLSQAGKAGSSPAAFICLCDSHSRDTSWDLLACLCCQFQSCASASRIGFTTWAEHDILLESVFPTSFIIVCPVIIADSKLVITDIYTNWVIKYNYINCKYIIILILQKAVLQGKKTQKLDSILPRKATLIDNPHCTSAFW